MKHLIMYANKDSLRELLTKDKKSIIISDYPEYDDVQVKLSVDKVPEKKIEITESEFDELVKKSTERFAREGGRYTEIIKQEFLKIGN